MLGALQQRLLHRPAISLLSKRSFTIQAHRLIPCPAFKTKSFSCISVFASHHRCTPANGLGFKNTLHSLRFRQDFSTNPKSQSGRELQPEIEDVPVPFNASKTSDVLTLPTVLTLSRVAAVPVLLSVFYASPDFATAVFVVASATDWLDGYLARKMKTTSAFGAFLDPVADKLMVAAALVLLCSCPPPAGLPLWLLPPAAVAIVGREIAMSALREFAAGQGPAIHKVVAVSSLGKWKTALQMVSISLLLGLRHPGLTESVVVMGSWGASGALYGAAALALLSLGQYSQAIVRALR